MIKRDEKDAFYIKKCSNQLVADNYFPKLIHRWWILFALTTIQTTTLVRRILQENMTMLFGIGLIKRKNTAKNMFTDPAQTPATFHRIFSRHFLVNLSVAEPDAFHFITFHAFALSRRHYCERTTVHLSHLSDVQFILD